MAEKISQGEETLIPKSEWVDKKEIQGTDAMVLQHPMMNRAFEKILDLHKPKHDIALVSLCTSTRPYSRYYPDLAYNSQKQMEKIIFSLAKIVKGDK